MDERATTEVGWPEQLEAWTATSVESVVAGAGLGLAAAVLLHWVVWPHLLGWRVGGVGKRRQWAPWEFFVATTAIGAWFGVALGTLGVPLFLWGLAMWAFNRTARVGNTSWDRP